MVAKVLPFFSISLFVTASSLSYAQPYKVHEESDFAPGCYPGDHRCVRTAKSYRANVAYEHHLIAIDVDEFLSEEAETKLGDYWCDKTCKCHCR